MKQKLYVISLQTRLAIAKIKVLKTNWLLKNEPLERKIHPFSTNLFFYFRGIEVYFLLVIKLITTFSSKDSILLEIVNLSSIKSKNKTTRKELLSLIPATF